MTTSLRKEIAGYLESNNIIINDSLDYHTGEILKLFEKRIDKIFKHYGACQTALDEVRELLK